MNLGKVKIIYRNELNWLCFYEFGHYTNSILSYCYKRSIPVSQAHLFPTVGKDLLSYPKFVHTPLQSPCGEQKALIVTLSDLRRRERSSYRSYAGPWILLVHLPEEFSLDQGLCCNIHTDTPWGHFWLCFRWSKNSALFQREDLHPLLYGLGKKN